MSNAEEWGVGLEAKERLVVCSILQAITADWLPKSESVVASSEPEACLVRNTFIAFRILGTVRVWVHLIRRQIPREMASQVTECVIIYPAIYWARLEQGFPPHCLAYLSTLDAFKVSSRRNSSSLTLRLHTYTEKVPAWRLLYRVVTVTNVSLNITRQYVHVQSARNIHARIDCLFPQICFGFLLSPRLSNSEVL